MYRFGDMAGLLVDFRLAAVLLGGGGVQQPVADDAAFESLPDLLVLANYPNVACKASGAPDVYGNTHDYLHQVFDAFGPDRTF